jgi:hypothetical protein
MHFRNFLLSIPLLFFACAKPQPETIKSYFEQSESIKGNARYLDSPYLTPGDRLYMVGHQNGTFPDLGWHVQGEMGGVWLHPIKLADGFTAKITINGNEVILNHADAFINYPFGNKLIYYLDKQNIEIQRFQFVPEGKNSLFIAFYFINKNPNDLEIDLDISVKSNLMPVWLGERTGMKDGKDLATFKDNKWKIKDELNEWHLVFGSLQSVISKTAQANIEKPNSSINALKYKLKLKPNQELEFPFAMAGSHLSENQAEQHLDELLENSKVLLNEKIKLYRSIGEKTKLILDDKELEKTFRWIKYNTHWLVRDVENQGRGLAAGLPDYPWWFGVDNEYTLKSLIATRQKDLVYNTIDLIYKFSNKETGQIMHEVSTNGAIFNPGNINETPQFVSLIWQVFLWTGDVELLNKYYPIIEKGLKWLLEEQDKDGNLLPDGFGMMEIHGLNSEMIDVAVYSQRAFQDASNIAKVLGKNKQSENYKLLSEKIKAKINTEFWVDEFKSYADFIGTKEQALQLIKDAKIRADTLNKPWAIAELKRTEEKIKKLKSGEKRGFVLHHNWVVNTPMEMKIAPSDKGLAALNTAQSYRNSFGMFVTGIDRDETAGNEDGSFAAEKKIFNYTGAVMTLPTGVQAIAENNYNRPDQALDLLKRMQKSFSYALPGSIYEVSPDFGMMTQAWNLYAMGYPIIQQFFGISPNAYEKAIEISPLLPTDWKNGKLENVFIGNNILNIEFRKIGGKLELKINQTEKYQITIKQPLGKFKKWSLNGKEIKPQISGETESLKTNEKTQYFVLSN